MSKVAELIEQLRAEAEPVDSGSFTFDAVEAVRRLDASRYLDRDDFLIPIVEGLIALGAQRVEVFVYGADVGVSAPGLELDVAAEDLGRLFASIFDDVEDDRSYGLSRLAVGVHMGLGHQRIRRVLLDVCGADYGHVALFAPDEEPELRRREGARPQVRVLFDRGLLDEALSFAVPMSQAELRAVTYACEYCDCPVTVLGERVSAGHPSLGYPTDQFEGLVRVRTGVMDESAGPTAVVLSEGIVADRFTLDSDQPIAGFVAFLDVRRPRRDLSQARVVREPRVEQALRVAAAEHESLARRLQPQEPGPPELPPPEPAPLESPPEPSERSGPPISIPLGKARVHPIFGVITLVVSAVVAHLVLDSIVSIEGGLGGFVEVLGLTIITAALATIGGMFIMQLEPDKNGSVGVGFDFVAKATLFAFGLGMVVRFILGEP